MDIDAALAYTLAAIGTVTLLQIRLPNGTVYTEELPMPQDSITKLRVEYRGLEGLWIFAESRTHKSYFRFIASQTLQQRGPNVHPDNS